MSIFISVTLLIKINFNEPRFDCYITTLRKERDFYPACKILVYILSHEYIFNSLYT